MNIQLDPVFFADDSAKILRLESTTKARTYLKILKIVELLTGSKVNNNKNYYQPTQREQFIYSILLSSL